MTKIDKLIICDIDGVLADCSHRLKYIEGVKKDWDKFYGAEMAEDWSNEIMNKMMRALYKPEDSCSRSGLLFLTGRPQRTLALTRLWLEKYVTPSVLGGVDKLDDYRLVGREDDDHRKSEVVKPELLREFLDGEEGKMLSSNAVIYLFDDDPMNVAALQDILEDYDYFYEAFVVGTERFK